MNDTINTVLQEPSLNQGIFESSQLSILNIIFGIIGIVGTAGTLYAIYRTKKSNREYNYIFQTVATALKKEDKEKELALTKQELADKESELSSLSKDVYDLQEKIRKEIPIEARKAVLKDRLEESYIQLQNYHSEVIKIKEKLEKLGENTEIPDDLINSIKNEIEPKYLVREKLSRQKTYLTIFSTISALSFGIIPGRIGNIIGGVILLGTLPLIYKIIWNSNISEGIDDSIIKMKMRVYSFLAISTLLVVIGVTIEIIGYYLESRLFRYSSLDENKMIFYMVGAGLIMIAILSAFNAKKIYSRVKMAAANNSYRK